MVCRVGAKRGVACLSFVREAHFQYCAGGQFLGDTGLLRDICGPGAGNGRSPLKPVLVIFVGGIYFGIIYGARLKKLFLAYAGIELINLYIKIILNGKGTYLFYVEE